MKEIIQFYIISKKKILIYFTQLKNNIKLKFNIFKEKWRTDKEFVFWTSFISIIIFLAIIYLIAIANVPSITSSSGETEKEVIHNFLKNFKKKLPENLEHINKRLSEDSKIKIDRIIDFEIEKLFTPIYDNISNYTNYHYSVSGEYSELGQALSGNMEHFINKKLFGDNFNEYLNDSIREINNQANNIISEALEDIQDDIGKELDIDNKEIVLLLSKFANISVNTMQRRLSNQITEGIRFGGTIAGVVVTKTIAKKATGKLMAKLASKGLLKYFGSGGGAVAGATAGSFLGPAGAIVGGIVGGAVAWFATDKVIVEIDKAVNSDDFRKNLNEEINNSKENIKKSIKQLYHNQLDILSKKTQNDFKKIQLPNM